jgi:hypothetical protein
MVVEMYIMEKQTMKKVLIALAMMASGCTPNSQDKTTETNPLPSKPAVSFSVSAPFQIIKNVCTAATLEVQASTDPNFTRTEAITAVLSQNQNFLIYSDSACTNSITQVVIDVSATSATFYYKVTTDVPQSIYFSAHGLQSYEMTASTNPVSPNLFFQQYTPAQLSVDAQHTIMVDHDFNKIFIWNSLCPGADAPTDVVLGIPQISSNPLLAITNSQTFGAVNSAFSDGVRLFAVDTDSNRVLIWNSFPTADFQPADIVLGQSDMNTGIVNANGLSASSLNAPRFAYVANGKLFVSDTGNHRILIWNTIPTTNNAAADVVVGQPDMFQNTFGVSEYMLCEPQNILISNGKLLVADSNNRIVIWNSIPQTNGIAADVVLGQSTMLTNLSSVSSTGLTVPTDMKVDSLGHLFVVDSGSNRIMVWNCIPTVSGAAADAVIGQLNFDENTQYPDEVNHLYFSFVLGIEICNNMLVIIDGGSNRLLSIDL